MKTCTKCGESKPLDAYQKHSTRVGYLRPDCRDCRNAQGLARYHRMDETQRARRQAGMRLAKYKLSACALTRMRIECNDLCEICKRPASDTAQARGLNIDHCHASGQVRGLLCWDCNAILGKVQDNPDLLVSMALYLERTKAVQAA